MALYEKSVRVLMRDMVAALGIQKGDVLTKERVFEWFAQHYPRVKEGTISAHLMMVSTNATSRMHYKPKPGEDDLFFQMSGGRYRLYDASTDPAPIRVKPRAMGAPVAMENEPGAMASELEDGESQQESFSEFAYESDLRDFLARNLHLVEPGLHLFQDEGINGVEFPVGGRFIDILAIDAKNHLVVIELKVSRGYDRVIGQLLRYMGWIAKHQAEAGQAVRGIIIARELTEDLHLACSGLPHVELFEYQMSVTLTRVAMGHCKSS